MRRSTVRRTPVAISGWRRQISSKTRGEHRAGEIEGEIAPRPHPILDRSTEQPERPHVEDQVQPAAVQKRIGDERQYVETVAELGNAAEILGRNQRVLAEKPLELCRAQADLIEEHQ